MTTPSKGQADYLELGSWNAVCSLCGRKRKASQLVRNWQGLWRCPEHNEPRNAQDFVRGIQDIQTPPWVQPMPTDTFVSICATVSALPDYAIAECMVADNTANPSEGA